MTVRHKTPQQRRAHATVATLNELRDLLDVERHARDLSVRAVAREAGVSCSIVHGFLAGHVGVSMGTTIRLLEWLAGDG